MSVVLKLTNVRKYFLTTKSFSQRKKEYVKAVEDVSFIIREGETVGLVGESGCGKTTVGRIILRLIAPTAGQVFFRDQDLFALRKEELRKTRKKMGVVFQDPYSSLNPRMSIQEIVVEPLKIHTNLKGLELQERMVELLKQVGLKEDCLRKYPHEFSGGQRQRIAIARALALNPAFLVLDEPTSA
ncbi:ABC transporter ATP-binding protein, partial [Candidatus Aerophobetes bacterium]